MPPARRSRPVTIVMRAVGPDIPLLELADELSRAMCEWGNVAVLYPEERRRAGGEDEPRTDAVARFGPLVERCELDHDHVIMVCGSDQATSAWDEFCMSHADRALAIVGEADPREEGNGAAIDEGLVARLHGSDLVGFGVQPGSGGLAGWIAGLAPASTFAIRTGTDRGNDVARMARRLAGRSVGVVLSGGGARAFAHLGVLEVLLEAGMPVDRVGGVSMGAFIGGLLAAEHDSSSMDATCYEEFVRRNPINDYTVPRSSLIKGQKAEAMLERVFGDVRLEELARPFYCASVNLRGNSLLIDHDGPMVSAIGASMSLPLIGPPMRRGESLLIDGSLLDNLPLAPMSSSGEGPVLAIDIKGGEERTRPVEGASTAEAATHPARRKRLPSLPETMARVALLSSANTDESARRYADMTIPVRVSGVGLLEFHQIDEARATGRRAALAALADAPEWLLHGGTGHSSITGRRTVLRV
jgi:predicted acylesterase/phospholipase RssA